MDTVSTLLLEIEAFCREAEIAEATFSTRAVNDGKFVRRLREGANVTVALVDRVRAYIAAERPKLGSKSGRAGIDAAEAATAEASAAPGEAP